jgi:vitamin B12 transporter
MIQKLFILSLVATVLSWLQLSANESDTADTGAAPSQRRADTAIDLGKIVVTATRTTKLVSEAPVSVSVITAAEIASSPAKTVEDLLITQHGVQATRTVAIGEGIPSSIIIRGIPGSLAASRTLILVDGIPTNASGTPFTIINEIPMEAIERVEIVRGPHSSLYGANAVGGVINILTKEGNGRPNGTVSAETSYPFTVVDQVVAKEVPAADAFRKSAQIAYWNGNVTMNGGNDKAGFLLSGGYRAIGNYLQNDSALRRNGAITYLTKAENYDYAEYRLFGKGRWYLADNCELSLHSRIFNSDLGFGRTKNIVPDSQNVDTRGNKFLIGPRLNWSPSPAMQIKAGAFYRQVVGEFSNEAQDSLGRWVPSIWRSNTKDWQLESQAVFSITSGNTLTCGFEYLDNNAHFGATTNRNTGVILPHSFSTRQGIDNVAVFAQDEMTLFGTLTVVPAFRLDYHNTFGAALSPKLGLNFRASDAVTLRASSGRSFRAPSLAELYLPDLTINPNVILVANAKLKPEYIWGSDAGFDWSPVRSVTLTLDGFYNAMENLISQTLSDPTIPRLPTPITHRNIAQSWSGGCEGELSWQLLSGLGFVANGVVQRSKDKMYNVPLDYIPEYTVKLKIKGNHRVRNTLLEAECGLAHVGTREYLDFANALPDFRPNGSVMLNVPLQSLDPHTSVDVTCKMTLASRLTFSVNIQNLFNAKWEEAPGTLMPQRFATVALHRAF